MSQLPLDLGQRPALGREAFLVAPANATALAMVDRWPDWPEGKLVIVGPGGAGKTHLAHVWAEVSGAKVFAAAEAPEPGAHEHLVLEDMDRLAELAASERAAAEERVFHLHNALKASGGGLLLTGRRAPAHWNIGLADLASRMRGAAMVELAQPDDVLLEGVLVKLFADRQIRVGPRLIPYLLRRMDRSVPAAERIVAELDEAALSRGRAVSRALAIELYGG